MANNQEFFCNHCKKTTLFFLESDLLWYCDECDNVLDSIPAEDIEDEYEEELIEQASENDEVIFRCPHCRKLVSLDTLEDGYLCPVCFDDLSDRVDSLGYEYDEESGEFHEKE